MKYRMGAVLLTVLLLCAIVPGALAAGEPQLDYVTDVYGLLTDSEVQELSEGAETLSEWYGCDIYIVILDDYTYYSNGSVRQCAEEIFTDYDLGYGSDRDGVLLLLSMADRDYALIAHGDRGNAAFTDYGKDVLSEEFLDDFADDRWFDGFWDYLSQCEVMLQMEADGEPLDRENAPMHPAVKLAIVVLVPCAVALVVCLILKGKMKSVAKKSAASEYIVPGGIHMTVAQDHLPIPPNPE